MRNFIHLMNLTPFLILLIAINSIGPYLSISIGNTTFWWIIQITTLLIFYSYKQIFENQERDVQMRIVLLYIIWNLFCIFRGLFVAESYWDWKGLTNNSMSLLIPVIAFSCTNLLFWQSILKFFLRFGIPLFFLILPLMPPGAYGFYLVPIGFLALFYPVVPMKGKIFILIFTSLVLFSDLGARSNIIKFIFPFLCLFFYYYRSFFLLKVLKTMRLVFIILPWILFSLAVTDTFNVFRMEEYLGKEIVEKKVGDNGEIIEENLTADTRTFLYIEVLQTAKKYNSWLIGRSPARGNETEYFALHSDVTGREERLGNEVAVLNIFTWTGLVGVIFYFFVFYQASYLAIYKSHNSFSKILGLFVAFRWLYAWVEDINYFTLDYIFIWVMIGLCFSKPFRIMSEIEVKCWVNGIFKKKKSFIKFSFS